MRMDRMLCVDLLAPACIHGISHTKIIFRPKTTETEICDRGRVVIPSQMSVCVQCMMKRLQDRVAFLQEHLFGG